MHWHTISPTEVLTKTGSQRQGLSATTAKEKLAANGPNELQEGPQRSVLSIFFSQFADIMILVLVAAAVISGLVGDLKDTLVISIIIVLNAVVGFLQEYRAEKAMQSLKKIAAPVATVIRDNLHQNIPATALVTGDIVLLEAGKIVPADIRLMETASLKIDESGLTGESVPAEKTEKTLHKEDLPPGDRLNMAFKGTVVTYGRATGIVTATGMETELGKIASMLQEDTPPTPLQKRMSDFSKKLSVFIILLCVLLFFAGYLRGEDWLKMLLTVLSLAVAAIPEALPAVITIALAMGAKRLVRNNALTRKLHAVETLGSVTYICTDKTGTLTENRMTVKQVKTFETTVHIEDTKSPLLLLALLNHDVKEGKGDELNGDPTEIAVYRYAIQHVENADQLVNTYPRVAEIPFDADRKLMTTIHAYKDKFLVVTKGAIESLLAVSADHNMEEAVKNEADIFAEKGMRVLGYGMKWLHHLPGAVTPGSIEEKLHIIGLAGMIDPPRPEAAEAIKECKSAGIIPVMITGDHPVTAKVIAKELGIISGKEDKTITGAALTKLDDGSFAAVVENIKVYARVSPEQKMRIIKALQAREHFVAMTGDGVNDAPSLKKANIGIAMGITGTDVSKESAHMILLDDNFATIVKAIKEGRRIYDNIRKFIKYIMTGNSAEIWAILLAPLIGLPVPLLPIHILWINLVTDGLPALALAMEPAEKNIMQRPPRRTDESIFSGGMAFHIVWVGLLTGGLTIGIQAFEIYTGSEHWQTIVFTVLCLGQMWHVMAIRSEYQSLFKQGLMSNKLLTGAVLVTFLLQLAIIYLPVLNTFFNTQPLTTVELLTAIGVSSVVFFAVEAEKILKRSRKGSA